MHKHAVRTCKHEPKICAECGDVYCLKCNKEWYKEKNYAYFAVPYTITWGNATYDNAAVFNVNTIDADPVLPSHTHVQ